MFAHITLRRFGSLKMRLFSSEHNGRKVPHLFSVISVLYEARYTTVNFRRFFKTVPLRTNSAFCVNCFVTHVRNRLCSFLWQSKRVLGSLQIRHSQESDEGKYECVAENSVGVAYSYAANLYVRGQCCIFYSIHLMSWKANGIKWIKVIHIVRELYNSITHVHCRLLGWAASSHPRKNLLSFFAVRLLQIGCSFWRPNGSTKPHWTIIIIWYQTQFSLITVKGSHRCIILALFC